MILVDMNQISLASVMMHLNMTKADKTYFHDRLDDWSSQGFEAAYDLMKRNKPVGE